MLKAIQAELYKLFKNRTFKVLICVAVLLSTLTVVMCSSVFEKILNDSLGNMPQDQKEVLMEQLTSMSESEAIVTPGQLGIQLQAKDMMNPTSIEVYHASFGSGVIEIIIGILVGALIAKEYSQGTIKNFLAYGKRREEFYLAKFVSMVIAVTIILAVMTILPTIVVTLMNGWGKAFEISQLLGMIKTFLPEATTLERAVTYRDKKIKPLFIEMKNKIGAMAAQVKELTRERDSWKSKFQKKKQEHEKTKKELAEVQKDYQKLSGEKEMLQGLADRYNRLLRMLGKDMVERLVQDDIRIQAELETRKQKEQMPKKISDRIQWARERSEEHNAQIKKNKAKYRGMEL